MHTRDISFHLSNYASLLYAEANRLHTIGTICGDDSTSVNGARMQNEADRVRDMAAELYDMKREV